MSAPFPVLPGERVLWAGARGEPARLPGGAVGCRIVYAWFLLCMFGGCLLFSLLVLPQTRVFAFGSVFAIAGGVVAYRRYRKKPAIFVTDRRLIERTILGVTSADLADIATYRRRVDQYVYQGTTSDRATNIVVLTLRSGGARSIGPVAEYDDLTRLLDGIVTRDVDVTTMRSMDGQPAEAEKREDVFVAVENGTREDPYGPLMIGPRGLVRFTSKLPIGVEGLLLTAIARAGSPEEVESLVVQLSRRPDVGHALVLDRSNAKLGMNGTTLEIDLGNRVERVQLSAADAERARKFLGA
jgi:hypothetical protein